ncbi:MAG: LON peptidase substrate-binding domain-containing protein, partial [Oscillospiraceae bacterium]|nr:LON peptidase substrate-binding domain-containing protein [Oscillospiraceae bacterium]
MSDGRVVITEDIPMMPLRGLTVFPGMILNFEVERPFSVKALDAATNGDRRIFLVAQRDIMQEDPGEDQLYKVGTVCILRQFIRAQNGMMRVLVEGETRARLIGTSRDDGYFRADVMLLPEKRPAKDTPKAEALLRQTVGLYEDYMEMSGNDSPEVLIDLTMRADLGYAADYVVQNIFLRHTEKQMVLETLDPV